MAIPLRELVDPATTALVTMELQNGIVGERSALPQLAEIARRRVIPNAARLAAAARAAGVQVVHCVAVRRPDGKGANHNARVFHGVARSPVALLPGSEAAAVVDEVGSPEEDLVLARLHGIGPMGGTDLDPILRNLGVATVVGIGVSLNLGMVSLALDALNNGYQVVLPRDAVAGIPEEYGEAVLDNSLSLVATLATTDDVVAAWST